jgi:hypothetical protein
MKGVNRFAAALILSLLATSPALSSHTYTLPVTDDAFVYSSLPSFHYGTYTNLLVSQAFDGNHNLTGERQSYLKFDLSGLANVGAAFVESVTLRLYVTSTSRGQVNAHHSSDIYNNSSSPWLETDITWGNKPLLSVTPMAVSPVLDPNNMNYFIDLLQVGKGWLAGDLSDHHLSVALLIPAGATTNTSYYFHSKETNPAIAQKPELTIVVTEFTLSYTKAGSGGGSVSIDPPGKACPGSCPTVFDGGNPVTLVATPDAISEFSGWTGASCGGSGDCQVVMDSDKGVTGTFDLKPVRIAGPAPSYYSTLGAAYAAAADGSLLQSREYAFTDDLDLDRDISVTLEGGYNTAYTGRSGYTTVQGTLTISRGALEVESLVML